MLFPLLIKDGNDNLLPQIHLHNINAFFEGLTGKHFYNSAYELHFLHADLQNVAQTSLFFHNNPAIIYLSRRLSSSVYYKK